MKFGYVMKGGQPIHVLHGSTVVTHDPLVGRREIPVNFVEAATWPEAVEKVRELKHREDVRSLQATIRKLTDAIAELDGELERVKREREEARAAATGDMAKLRDALRKCVYELEPFCDGGCRRDEVLEEARKALAAQQRNCDMFGGNPKMLRSAWWDWTGSPSGQNSDGTVKLSFGEWLLAPTTGKAV